MSLFKLLLAASLTLGLLPTVNAQDNWPQKPIRILLGFPAGGGSDMVARLVAKSLSDRLGQNVVVDNKPGAGGNIATEMLVRAPGDGYKLLLVPSGHASGAAMKKSLPFDPIKDLAWVSTITTYPLAFTVAPNSPIRSYADLIQKPKQNPTSTPIRLSALAPPCTWLQNGLLAMPTYK